MRFRLPFRRTSSAAVAGGPELPPLPALEAFKAGLDADPDVIGYRVCHEVGLVGPGANFELCIATYSQKGAAAGKVKVVHHRLLVQHGGDGSEVLRRIEE